jgi:hypothetical protein
MKWRAVLLGTAVVGTLDLLDALIFFGLRGVAPIRIPQSIAAGLLGPASFQGGAATAALGIALHFFIALVIVLVYHLAGRVLRILRQSPLVFGPVYGIGVYLVMNFVVLPLSAAGAPRLTAAVVVNGVLIHMLGVGLPAALSAGWAQTMRRRA